MSLEAIKTLRDRTGISIAQCRTALEEAGGDLDKALEHLRAKGAALAEKKAGRTLAAGVVRSYIHSGNAIGVLVRLECETDFVAKNPDFVGTADDLAMHIAAFEPADVAALLEQPFVKDPSQTVDSVIKGLIQKFGEKVVVGGFVRETVNH